MFEFNLFEKYNNPTFQKPITIMLLPSVGK